MSTCSCMYNDFPCAAGADTRCPICYEELCTPCYLDHHECIGDPLVEEQTVEDRELVPA